MVQSPLDRESQLVPLTTYRPHADLPEFFVGVPVTKEAGHISAELDSLEADVVHHGSSLRTPQKRGWLSLDGEATIDYSDKRTRMSLQPSSSPPR